MAKRLYVGNLSYSTTDQRLREMFAQHGEVLSAELILDRMTGQSRGFGFVEMASPADATRAIEAMHGADLDGRSLVVGASQEQALLGGRPSALERGERRLVVVAHRLAAIRLSRRQLGEGCEVGRLPPHGV